MPRPVGITVLGALVSLAALIMVLIGIASFFVGLAFLIPGTPISGTELILNGILYFFIGVALGIAGGGLLMMRPWAWGVALIATLVTLVYLGYRVYERSNAGSGTTLTSLLTLATVAIIFVYLLPRPAPSGDPLARCDLDAAVRRTQNVMTLSIAARTRSEFGR